MCPGPIANRLLDVNKLLCLLEVPAVIAYADKVCIKKTRTKNN